MSKAMLESGINNVAAALVYRKVLSLGIECKLKITGSEMNHTIWIKLKNGDEFTIHNAKDWFLVYRKLREFKNLLYNKIEGNI